jgi:hypothetical protein
MPTDLEKFREPVTAQNTVLLLIDHQERMLAAVGDQPNSSSEPARSLSPARRERSRYRSR